MPEAVTVHSHGTHYFRRWEIFLFSPHLQRGKWKWGEACAGMKWVAWIQPVMREWKRMTSSCRRRLRREGRGGETEAGSHMNGSYSSLLMTPTVPFYQRQGLPLSPSHIFSHDPPSCPRFIHTHAQTWAHTEWKLGESGDEREVGWALVTGQTQGMCSRVALAAVEKKRIENNAAES